MINLPIPPWILQLAFVAAVLYVAIAFSTRRKTSSPLPPGPKPLPLIGNLHDLPPPGVREWEHWYKHRKEYGPISSLNVLGTTMIILNDAAPTFELMEKRGQYHSARPRMVFAGEMCGWDHLLVSASSPEQLREIRKRMHQVIGTPSLLSRFEELQEVEAHRFLLRTIEKPDDVVKHLKTEAGAIILKIAYGYTIEPHKEDPLVDIGDRGLSQFSAAAAPGVWMVDQIPALRYLPEWMPGTAFKKTAKEWRATLMELAERPIQFVKQEMREKRNTESFVSKLYNKVDGDLPPDEESKIKWSAAALYTGGADTSVSTMATFFLGMLVNPEVQTKAREEIDRVVGRHQLPTIADRPNLPYVNAVVQECFRWHPIAPMGLPHVTTQDDICQGYLIPKGAMLIPNIWAMTHDEKVYPDPMSFNPDRFLANPAPPDPQDFVFGFGRRICPGRLLADSSVWLTLARSLAALDISKGVDEQGKTIEPVAQFTPGIISHPHPYKANIKARSAEHEQLIRRVLIDHPWERSDAEKLQNIVV